MIESILSKLIILTFVLVFLSIHEFYETSKIKKYWKQWEQDSFEFNGTRYNKKFYKIENGKMVERKQ